MKGDKFEPIMVAIAESELQRFRELKTENTLLKVQIESLKKENEQEKCELLGIIQQKDKLIKKMKCCENCKHQYYENGINYCNNRCRENLYNNWELKGL